MQHPETRTLCRESRSGSSTSASHAESLESKLKEPSGSVAGAAACCGATIFSTGVRGSDAKADRRHRQPAVDFRYHTTPAATVAVPAASASCVLQESIF